MIAKRINRVRCVLAHHNRYLLVQHNNRLPEYFGKWGLLGGILESAEDPAVGLRRELAEEFQIRIGNVVLLGDWEYRHESHRVFGCQMHGGIETYDSNEILDITWLTYDGVVDFAEAGKLHTGFELAAISEFRSRAAGRLARVVKISRMSTGCATQHAASSIS